MYRASTDKMGLAKVALPDGAFELTIWKLGYHPVSKSIDVGSDFSIQLKIEALPEEVNEYWMGLRTEEAMGIGDCPPVGRENCFCQSI